MTTPEGSLDRACRRIALARGCLWLKLHPATLRGIPDRLLVTPNGLLAFIELKAPGGVVAPLQRHRGIQLKAMGCIVLLIRETWHLEQMLDKWGL